MSSARRFRCARCHRARWRRDGGQAEVLGGRSAAALAKSSIELSFLAAGWGVFGIWILAPLPFFSFTREAGMCVKVRLEAEHGRVLPVDGKLRYCPRPSSTFRVGKLKVRVL